MKRLKGVIVFGMVILLLLIVYGLSYNTIKSFLAYTKKCEHANVLVIEGWMGEETLLSMMEELNDEQYEYILVTGTILPDYFFVSMNGFFSFYLDNYIAPDTSSYTHKISVRMFGELPAPHASHVNLLINDSVCDSFYLDPKPECYEVSYYGNLNNIDSVSLNFDNDAMGDFGDHNLSIRDIIIDDSIHISYRGNSAYNRTYPGWQKRFEVNHTTFAGKSRNILLESGIDSTLIYTLPGDPKVTNETLANAISVSSWMDTARVHIAGVNILSVGTHARRSWMAYKEICSREIEIGIISIKEMDKFETRGKEFSYTLKEFFGLLYYRLLLLFY